MLHSTEMNEIQMANNAVNWAAKEERSCGGYGCPWKIIG